MKQPLNLKKTSRCGFARIASFSLMILGFSLPVFAADDSEKEAPDPATELPAIALKADPAAAPIIPWPMRGEVGSARIVIPSSARLVASSPELEPLAEILAGQIMRLSGRDIPRATGTPKPGDICLRITPDLSFADDPYLKLNPELKNFEYRIKANTKGFLIEGENYQATALATATLLQCLQGSGATLSYPPMQIEDKPASVYSGVMLDVARQWHPPEVLKDIIDLCQFYKVPYFHLHLTDDQGYRLPSKVFPNLPAEESYSEKELRDLVAYADARGVTIVPEMEMPGHSTPIQKVDPEIFGAMDEASGEAKALGVINIANPDVYPALEKLIAEACDIFKSSPYFHIGADETNFSVFNNNPQVQKQVVELSAKEGIEAGQMFSYFLNRINAMVKKQGKQTICWEGFGSGQKVDKDILVFAWHGSSNLPQNLLESGYRIMNTPWFPSVYASVRNNYEWNIWKLNLNEFAVSKQFDTTPQVVGGSMLLWERSPDDALELLRLKTPARHERIYSPYAQVGYDHFAKRLTQTDAIFEKLVHPMSVKLDGLNNIEENLASGPVKVTTATPIEGGKIRYAFNAKEVTASDPISDGTITIGPELSKRGRIRFYDGPSAQLRLQVFDAQDLPLGGEKIVEVRHDIPRIKYTVRALPPGPLDFPEDSAKLREVKSGSLATFDGTNGILAGSDPLFFESHATVEILAPGTYRLVSRSRKGDASKTRIKFGDGEWLVPDRGGIVSTELPVGIYPVVVQQVTSDGVIVVSFTFSDPPMDPTPNPRNFGNRALNYWMKPL